MTTTTVQPVSRADRAGIPTLVGATVVSNLGNGVTILAVPWFVFVTTGSAARTGIVGAATTLAYVVAGIFGGPLVDRLGFKRTSVLADVLSGVTVALIPTLHFLDILEYWHLLVLVFMGAVFDGPGQAARESLVPVLARRTGMALERANGAMQFASNGSQLLLGPLVFASMIALFSAAGVLYIDAATFALSAVLIGLLIRPSAARQSAVSTELSEQISGERLRAYFSDLLKGFQFVARDPFLSIMLPLSAMNNFLFTPTIAVILPVFAKRVFDSAGALGVLVGAFGAGTLAGALAISVIGQRFRRYLVIVWTGVLVAIGFWLLALSNTVWLGAAGLFLVGASWGFSGAVGLAIFQTRVPEEQLGRITGLSISIAMVATPIGVLAGGFLIEWTSIRLAMVVVAIGFTIVGAVYVGSRRIREVASEFDAPSGAQPSTASE